MLYCCVVQGELTHLCVRAVWSTPDVGHKDTTPQPPLDDSKLFVEIGGRVVERPGQNLLTLRHVTVRDMYEKKVPRRMFSGDSSGDNELKKLKQMFQTAVSKSGVDAVKAALGKLV